MTAVLGLMTVMTAAAPAATPAIDIADGTAGALGAVDIQGRTDLPIIEAFAMDPAMTTAQVSPDGTALATIERRAKDGDNFIFIYDTADLTRDPVTLSAARMDVVDLFWANNERIIVTFRQDVGMLGEEGTSTRLLTRIASIDRRGEEWVELPQRSPDRRSDISQLIANFSVASIIDTLPWDPDHVLIRFDDDQNGIADTFKVNVATGASQLVAKDSNKLSIQGVDFDGEVRLASGFDPASLTFYSYAREKGEDEWLEIGSSVANPDAFSLNFSALGFFNEEDPNELLVLSNHDADTSGIYTFDVTTQAFKDLLFRHPRYDATGVATALSAEGKRQIIAYSYIGKGPERVYVDAAEQSLYDAIDGILPEATNRIVSRSADDAMIVIRSEGPRRPPSWYLLRDKARIDFIGTQYPFLEEDELSSVDWKAFRARDGLTIPTLITIPDGEGPFPVVVNPHGGPAARDVWGFDLWAQLLAHHGYLVVQPQFRFSTGFGREHVEAGYRELGLKMMDDVEDAVRFVVSQGLGDPDRTAVFGWSHGGYDAFVGAFRDPNPFQCAIAGAGVSDLAARRSDLFELGSVTQRIYRESYFGISPLEHVDSVDIPILVIHGSIDERVPVYHSRRFVDRLEAFGKQHKYIELEGANHFFGTIYYRHWMEMFPAMIDWLDNTCGLKAD